MMKQKLTISRLSISVLWAMMLSVIGVYAFYILFHAEWLIGDDAFMLNRTAMGIPFAISDSIIPSDGFFRPFDYLHENIVLLFHSGMHSAFEHYIINAVSFVLCMGALIGILWKTVKPKDVCDHAIIALGAIVIASRLIGVYINIFGPIFGVYTYHMLAIFFLCQFMEKDKTWAMVLSLFCWAYSMLIYENVCMAIGCMGLFPLIFVYKRLSKKQRIYCYTLIGMAIAFIIAYVCVIYIPTRGISHYDPAHNSGVGLLENAKNILMGQKFILLAALVWLWRQIQLIRKQTTYHILYDTLLWAAGGMVAGAIVLRLNWVMYYYDAIILSLPAVVYFLLHSHEKYGKYIVVSIMLLFAMLHTHKVPKTIRENQKDRIETASCMHMVANAVSEGKGVVWMDRTPADEASDLLQDWRMRAVRSYVRFLVCDKAWDYDEFYKEKSIVLFVSNDDKYGLVPEHIRDLEKHKIGLTSGVSYCVIE